MTDTSGGTDRRGASDAGPEQTIDDLGVALGRLREAVDRLRVEIEANAKEEWVRAKPELKTAVGDLQAMVDAAADRAKVVLSDLGARLDANDKRDHS